MCVILLSSVFLDVYDVLCPVYLNTCVRVCHSFDFPSRECLRARRFRATLLLHLHLYVIGALAVWIPQTRKRKVVVCLPVSMSLQAHDSAVSCVYTFFSTCLSTCVARAACFGFDSIFLTTFLFFFLPFAQI